MRACPELVPQEHCKGALALFLTKITDIFSSKSPDGERYESGVKYFRLNCHMENILIGYSGIYVFKHGNTL